jgi:hypothetical protein
MNFLTGLDIRVITKSQGEQISIAFTLWVEEIAKKFTGISI